MRRHRPITRRDFMRHGAQAAAALPLLGLATDARGLAPRAALASRVSLVRDAKALPDGFTVDRAVLQRMLDETVRSVTGAATPRDAWRSLFRPTDVVGLVPSQALNPTHPELVELVHASLRDVGVPDENIRDVQNRRSRVGECTALVCLPGLKAHWLTGLGTVLKNYIMFADTPSAYHDERSVNLGEIWKLPHVKGKTKLVLVDALRPLCDKGPQPDPRYLWPYQGLIAGTDPVAVESVGLRVIEAKRTALRGESWPLSPPALCVAAADSAFHLGTSRWPEITLDQRGWTQDLLL